MKREREKPVIYVKGLDGWHEEGIIPNDFPGSTTTYSCPTEKLRRGVPAIDMSAVYERDGIGASAVNIWHRPILNAGLAPDNVRSLFEGCIGCEGSTEGHLWDGKLESLNSCDSVGVNVYVAILLAAGGTRVQ